MKGGKVPVHIQRWAPADFQEDEDVKLLLKRKDFAVYAFYRQFLDCSFMAGGDLSSNVERLSAVLGLSEKVVEAGLEFCLGRLIHQEGDRLYQSRVRAEVADELAFRETQAEHGKRRWSKGSHRLASGKPNGGEEGSLSPPAPSASALRQRQAPSPNGTGEFAAFWSAYPRKVAKAEAQKAWKQTADSRPDLPALLSRLETLKTTPQWCEAGGKYVPYPASWLRAGGWDDDPAAFGANGGQALSGRTAPYTTTSSDQTYAIHPNDPEKWYTPEQWAAAYPELPWPG